MAKKQKQQQKQKKSTPVASYEVQDVVRVPEVCNIDTLAYMSDDDLRSMLSNLYNELDAARKNNDYDVNKLWEVEIAYVLREQGVRRNRQKAHEEWSKHHSVVVFEDVEETVN